MLDVDKNFESIQNNNVLRVMNAKFYMNRNIKAQSWAIVDQAVCKDWTELSSDEK